MKNILLATLCSILFASCVEVKFPEAQPINTESLKEFPTSLQGNYLVNAKDTIIDTVIIGSNYYTDIEYIKLDSSNKREVKKMFLSDSLVLKKVADSYTINFKEKENWYVVILKPLTKYDVSIVMIDTENNEAIEKLKHITKVDVERDDEDKIKAYRLNPTKAEFEKLIEIEGILTEIYRLKKLQE